MTDSTTPQDDKAMSPASTGSAQPALYAVMHGGAVMEYCRDEDEAADSARHFSGSVVPLYRSPTLTDAEREAVDAALGWCDDRDTKTIATLRGLLERTRATDGI